WTWGCGEFGKAWDRQLTDADGPYIELMCGVYTDNQPDFSWLAPGEEKAFSQFFMPYKGVGVIKNATVDAAVGLEVVDSQVTARVYTTAEQHDARIVVSIGQKALVDETFNSSPESHCEFSSPLPSDVDPERLQVVVSDQYGHEL